MQAHRTRPVSGHVFPVDRKRGKVWFAKYRLPDGRQVQQKIGPHWPEKSSPPDGYFTKRTAQQWLDEVLVKARRGDLPGMVKTNTTFAAACDAWLDFKRGEDLKRSTLTDYELGVRVLKATMAHIAGDRARLEAITVEDVEAFRDKLVADGKANRTVNKYLAALYDLFDWARKPYGLMQNPADRRVRRRPKTRRRAIQPYSTEEVAALARAAASDQDAAIFQVAAFTGLRRGELLALRWGDLDFEDQAIHVRRNWTNGSEETPKGNEERVAPMPREAAQVLARLATRDEYTGDGDLVFCGKRGGHLNGDKLSARYTKARDAAGLRPLTFHELRHTFASRVAKSGRADVYQLARWMGHQDIKTTQIYFHLFGSHREAVQRLDGVFSDEPEAVPAAT